VVNLRIPTIFLLLLFGSGPLVFAAETLHDPLRPSVHSVAAGHKAALTERQEPDWQLTAVLISDTRLLAVLNGRTVRVGDDLDGYRVKSIEKNKVVLGKNKRTLVVPRVGTGLKKAVPAGSMDGKEGSTQ